MLDSPRIVFLCFLSGIRFMDPLLYGDYPEIVKKNAGYRIPVFTKNQSELVKGSFDFIGVNYYNVVSNKHKDLKPEPRDYLSDMAAEWICTSCVFNLKFINNVSIFNISFSAEG